MTTRLSVSNTTEVKHRPLIHGRFVHYARFIWPYMGCRSAMLSACCTTVVEQAITRHFAPSPKGTLYDHTLGNDTSLAFAPLRPAQVGSDKQGK